MKTIWKWELLPTMMSDPVGAKISMPVGAKILDIQTQFNKPQIWAFVDPMAEKELRYFKCYGTGHKMPDNPGKYLATFQIDNQSLIFHVFEQNA